MLSCWAFAPVFKLTYGRKRKKKKSDDDDNKQAALSSFALYYQCYCLNSQWAIQKKKKENEKNVSERTPHHSSAPSDRRRESMKEWAEPRPTASAEASFFEIFFFLSLHKRIPACIALLFAASIKLFCRGAAPHGEKAPYNILRDSYLPNIHILSKYLTVVLYYVLLAYFPKMC